MLPPLALAGFGVWLVLSVAGSSTRVTQSFHGLHHAAYGYQILNGIIPPTNPSSLGMPANFYWGWHALLAALASSFEVSVFEASVVVNALALGLLLVVLWWGTGSYTRSVWVRVGFCLLPFLILNPVGVTQFSARAATALAPELVRAGVNGGGGEQLLALARHHPLLEIHSNDLDPLLPRGGIFGAVELHDRVASLINKFFNFNSFPAALALFALCVVSLSDERLAARWRCLAIAVGCAGMALFSPLVALAFGFYIVAHCLVVSVDLWPRLRPLLTGGGEDTQAAGGLGEAWRLMAPCRAPALAALAGIVLALPLVLPVAGAYAGSVAVYGEPQALARHWGLMAWVFLPSLPVYLVAGFRLAELPTAIRVHWLAGLLLAAATLFLSIPENDPNEYKFALLSSIPSSLLLLGLAVSTDRELLLRWPSWRVLRAVLVGCLLIGGVAALGATSLIYLASDWATENPYGYAGRNLVLRSEGGGPKRAQLQEAYHWLRSETPPQAFVLQQPVSKDELELSALAQRRVVAALPSMFTAAIPHHEALLEASRDLVAKLRRCRLVTEDLRRLFAVGAPWPGEIYAVIARDPLRDSGRCEGERPPGVESMFSNAAYEILRIAAPPVR